VERGSTVADEGQSIPRWIAQVKRSDRQFHEGHGNRYALTSCAHQLRITPIAGGQRCWAGFSSGPVELSDGEMMLVSIDGDGQQVRPLTSGQR